MSCSINRIEVPVSLLMVRINSASASFSEGLVPAAGATDGLWTAALTPVAAGAANVVPSVLVNSDGSDVNETEGPNTGQPFAVPASVQVTVTPDNTPTGFSLSVTG